MTTTPNGLPPTLTFTFAPVPGISRQLTTHTPDEGTLAVWSASAERFSKLGAEWADESEALAGRADDDPDVLAFRARRNQQATRALVRAMKIVTSALVDPDDGDWIEEMLLERKIGLGDALGVITGAVAELQRIKGTISAAPTNGPVKKARRG